MRSRILNAWRALALIAVLAVVPGIVTCDHTSAESLLVLDVQPVTRQNGCAASAAGGEFLSFGTMDLLLTNQYWARLHFRNMLLPIGTLTGESPASLVNEVHYMSVQRAKIFVNVGEFSPGKSDSKTDAQLAYKYQFTGVESFANSWAEPQADATISVQLITPELGAYFMKKMKALKGDALSNKYPAIWITVYASLVAETQDRNVITSNEFSFPIQLCWGCLVRPFCSSEVTDIPCLIGQEEPVDAVVCPYVALNPLDCRPKCTE